MESTTIAQDEQRIAEQAEVRHFVDLPKFGPFHYTDSEAITFPWGMPGFAELRRYVILAVPDSPDFYWLQSLENLDLAIPLIDPWTMFDDYALTLPPNAQISLDINHPDDFTVLCVVVVQKNGENVDQAVNLLAPIIVNLKNNVGRQVMLEGTNYSIRTPMPAKPQRPE